MGFLRNYVSIFPTVVAVLNGLLAVFLTQYPFETPAAKLSFIVIVILLSVAAIGATFYSQHLILAKQTKERERILTVREQLGTFIAEGTDLLNLAATASVPLQTDRANEWAAKVHSFLTSKMGSSYVARFRNGAGILAAIPTEIDAQHQRLWEDIHSRMVRLEQFSEEVSQ